MKDEEPLWTWISYRLFVFPIAGKKVNSLSSLKFTLKPTLILFFPTFSLGRQSEKVPTLSMVPSSNYKIDWKS